MYINNDTMKAIAINRLQATLYKLPQDYSVSKYDTGLNQNAPKPVEFIEADDKLKGSLLV